jgi:tryptophan aminotransferase
MGHLLALLLISHQKFFLRPIMIGSSLSWPKNVNPVRVSGKKGFSTPILHHLSQIPVRGLLPLESTPGLISFLAGKPNPTSFPFASLSFTANNPSSPSEKIAVTVDPQDLQDGLQYGPTAGHPKLLGWLYELQKRMHGRKPEGEGWILSVGSGSQDLIYKV